MARCWYCDEDVPAKALAYDARLLPRTAAKGGPLLLLHCAGCGQANLVEKNAAGETLLSPPAIKGHVPAGLGGAAAAAGRRWMAEHAAERESFLAARRVERARLPASPRSEEPAPRPEIQEDPEPQAVDDSAGVTDLLAAYAVLDLPLTATAEEVRKQYRKLARTCHPDRVADLDLEIRELADRKFRRLKAAYDAIAKECPRGPPGSR